MSTRRWVAALRPLRSLRRAALLPLALAAACGRGAPARLQIGQVTTDAAPAAASTLVARVEIRNDGGRELLLHGARLDCGCRLAAPLPGSLASGEQATLAVRCRAASEPSARPREISLLSSDPEHPEVAVQIVLPQGSPVGIEPAALYFGYVAIGASAVGELSLRSDENVAAPALPDGTDPAFTIEQRPPRADGRRVVRVRFTPRVSGPFHAALALGGATDTLPVSGVGYRGLIALPAEVSVPSETTGGAPPAIAVKAVGPAPVTITAVETPAGLVGELQTTTPGREYRLLLRARGGRVALGGGILLHTSDPDEPVLTIPLRDGSA